MRDEVSGYAAGWSFKVRVNQFNTKRLAAPSPEEFKVFFQIPAITLVEYAAGRMNQPFFQSVLNGIGDVQIETEASLGANTDGDQTTEVSQFGFSELPLVGECVAASGQIIIPQLFKRSEAGIGTQQPKVNVAIVRGQPRIRHKTVNLSLLANTAAFVQIPPWSKAVSIHGISTTADMGINFSAYVFAGPATAMDAALTMVLPIDLTKKQPIPWNATKIYLTSEITQKVRLRFEREL